MNLARDEWFLSFFGSMVVPLNLDFCACRYFDLLLWASGGLSLCPFFYPEWTPFSLTDPRRRSYSPGYAIFDDTLPRHTGCVPVFPAML
jgi:hypothetical protein